MYEWVKGKRALHQNQGKLDYYIHTFHEGKCMNARKAKESYNKVKRRLLLLNEECARSSLMFMR